MMGELIIVICATGFVVCGALALYSAVREHREGLELKVKDAKLRMESIGPDPLYAVYYTLENPHPSLDYRVTILDARLRDNTVGKSLKINFTDFPINMLVEKNEGKRIDEQLVLRANLKGENYTLFLKLRVNGVLKNKKVKINQYGWRAMVQR